MHNGFSSNAKSESRWKQLIENLWSREGKVYVVGQGSQSEAMTTYLWLIYRIKIHESMYSDSWSVGLDGVFYILCATPKDDALATLTNRGINPDLVVSWTDLAAALNKDNGSYLFTRLGLLPKHATDSFFTLNYEDQTYRKFLLPLQHMLYPVLCQGDSAPFEMKLIEDLAKIYLNVRLFLTNRERKGLPEKKFLFPSTGRCGGTSIADALSNRYQLVLNIDHEGHADALYDLLKKYHGGEISVNVLACAISLILDQNDVVGSNPSCFYLPYLNLLPWFECHVLNVTRNHDQLLESICLRNFHYTQVDYVANRITAFDMGHMSKENWTDLSIEDKVSWYINTVQNCITSSKEAYKNYIEIDITDIKKGINQGLSGLDWPPFRDVVCHLNTIPKDRIYSLEERINIYKSKKFNDTPNNHE